MYILFLLFILSAMSGVCRWIPTRSEHIKKSIETVLRVETFSFEVHNEPGTFTVKTPRGKYSVVIGNLHKCSCKKEQPCIHVLFLLIRTFCIEPTSELLNQSGLLDATITDLFNKYDTMRSVLTSCALCKIDAKQSYKCKNCEQCFHWKCVELASRVRGTALTCPSCANPITKDASAVAYHCTNCKITVEEYYRCLLCICDVCILCRSCYSRGKVHSSHPFVYERKEMIQIQTTTSVTNINDLQYRDLNPEDYDALLSLDNSNKSHTLHSEDFSKLLIRNCTKDEVNSCCAICLENFTVNCRCVVLPCKHILHINCGKNWLTKHKAECPIDHVILCVSG